MARTMVLAGARCCSLWGSESWVVSARAGKASPIIAGWRAGETLRDVYPEFPLLFKVIDARKRTSVQVHPDETAVSVTGGDPKAEMWCMLSDGPIYAGLKPGIDADGVERALSDGSFSELLVKHDAKEGDVFFIPGGLVHAIGDGVVLFEVQQSSDTTFRLYDWNRVDADGNPRALHVEKALQAADFSLPPPTACGSVDTPLFEFGRIRVNGRYVLAADEKCFTVGFSAGGEVLSDGFRVGRYMCFLVPPGEPCVLEGADVEIMITKVPVR